MNLNNAPTPDQLRELLVAGDDRNGRHVLWVDRAGEVRLSPLQDEDAGGFDRHHPDVQMWLREFDPGEAFVGPRAAADQGWVEDLFFALTRNWPKASARSESLAVEDW
ncbi:MAG: hypothetical protein K2V38_08030 [Gemmataceae bacterium]|nr:hypothetical protein [Gemmataceae bacterium]